MNRYIIYCRKSTESEDRQVLSIESQINELKKLSERLNLKVIDILTESKSAKSPGRAIFGKILDLINTNKIDGIICWKLDRLARNPIDGGQIIWMLQKGTIKHIQTFDRGYFPEDNVLLMNVEFGMANQYVLDLSKNVKRGLKTKAEKGWYPAPAPIGYLNDKSKEIGRREIMNDPERYELVKKMWDLMISGNYTPPKIMKKANTEWGYRSVNGKPISRSNIYNMFSNPFYYGWYEYPLNSGNWYKGNHEPMVTKEEFERIQILLGRPNKPRIKRHTFPFTGKIRCGECRGTVTAEEKNQIICSECKFKFSSNNKSECPKCETKIIKMKNPTILHYEYYHCTKKINPKCSQKSIEAKNLEKKILKYLSGFQISENFKTWAIKYLQGEFEKEKNNRGNILASQRKAYEGCLRRLDNLFQLKISPLNGDGNLLSDKEYLDQKVELMKEKARLKEFMDDYDVRMNKWMDIGEKTFNFARNAKYTFEKGSPEEKTQVLSDLGSNLVLKDKKLEIQLQNQYSLIQDIVQRIPETKARFEPKKTWQNEAKLEEYFSNSPVILGALDEVRTWIINTNRIMDLKNG